MKPSRTILMSAFSLLVVALGLIAEQQTRAKSDSTKPTQSPKKTAPSSATSDLDYWLQRAKPATTQPANASTSLPSKQLFHSAREFRHDDALPGVIEFSDGIQIAGGVYTTRDTPWKVWVAEEKRWRRIPPAAVLSISADVVQEEMKLRWRWKGMGEPEKVYTGKRYPFRRMLWRFRLADGSEITGAVKGQPLWIETPERTHGPFLLQERMKGKDGQPLGEQIYPRNIIISRRMMEKVQAETFFSPSDTPNSKETQEKTLE